MAIVAEVRKNPSEQTLSLIRRFSKRVQGSKAVIMVKERRYYERKSSKLKKKKRALKGIENRKIRDHLYKLGKIVEKEKKRGGRR